MDIRYLRETSASHLDAVPVSRPFDLFDYCDAVAAHRGRAIRLFESAGPFTSEHPSAAWVAMAEEDHVYLAEGLTPAHRALAALHEIAHMWLGHDPRLIFGRPARTSSIGAQRTAATARRALARAGFARRQERDAETLASLIMEQAGIGPAPNAQASAPHAELVDRLAESLAHPVRTSGGRRG